MTECDDIREKINRYSPGNTELLPEHGYQRVALQLFGRLGHGMSSLINSCVCVAKDEIYQNLADARQTDGGLTYRRSEYELKSTLVMIDNRGFFQMNSKEILEACGQLRSLRDMGEVNWQRDHLDETLRQMPLKYSDRPADYIVPVLVYSARVPVVIHDLEELVTHAFSITGIHPIVVMTSCATGNRNEIERMLGDLGVMHRHFLENYTENDHQRSVEKDRKFLEFLNTCIEEAERGIRLRQNQDPQTRFVTQAAEQIKQEADVLREENKTENNSLTRKNEGLSTENNSLKEQVNKKCTLS